MLQNDETYHWYVCLVCERPDGENKTKHAYDNDCDTSCNTCGKERTTEHVPNSDDGDCTTAVTCALCGNVTTPAKNHDFSGAWEKDESGHWHVCKNDGCSVTDTKASHISNDVENEPGAQLCAECGYESTVVIPHIHEWGTVKYEWNANYTKCTATRACIKNEQHVETESATITSEITIAASCVSNGEIVYTATFTNENFATQTETVEIPASTDDHEYGELTVEWNADYSDCVVSRYCSAGEHGDEELTKTISDNNGVKTVSVYDGSEDKIAVYVCGAVVSPGVYYISEDAIKEEALILAGGFADGAATTYVNLAEKVSGGEQIYFPYEDEEAMLDAMMEAEVDVQDLSVEDGEMMVKTAYTDFGKAQEAIEKLIPNVEFDTCEVTMLPNEYVTLDTEEEKEAFQKLMNMLNDCDDVNKVYHNVQE